MRMNGSLVWEYGLGVWEYSVPKHVSDEVMEDEHKIKGRQSPTPWELPSTAGDSDPALTP